jgi:hypothetical protein
MIVVEFASRLGKTPKLADVRNPGLIVGSGSSDSRHRLACSGRGVHLGSGASSRIRNARYPCQAYRRDIECVDSETLRRHLRHLLSEIFLDVNMYGIGSTRSGRCSSIGQHMGEGMLLALSVTQQNRANCDSFPICLNGWKGRGQNREVRSRVRETVVRGFYRLVASRIQIREQ